VPIPAKINNLRVLRIDPSRYLLPNLTGVFVLIQTRTNKGGKWEVRATPSRTARIVAQQRDSAVSPYPMSFSAAASSVAPSRAIETNRWIASAQDRCTTIVTSVTVGNQYRRREARCPENS
jgi:hypothetical protein